MTLRVSSAPMAVAAWALFTVLAVWLTLKSGGPGLETDAAMRLAGVRDLIAGQSWYDTAQHRMDTPFGLPMHWSRLADLGPAVLLLLLHPLGSARAETAMLYVWPLVTFLPVMLALARIAGHMAGRAAAVMVLPLALLCVEIYGLFAPGGIDHHNLQLALTLWTLLLLIEQRPAAAALAIAVSLGDWTGDFALRPDRHPGRMPVAAGRHRPRRFGLALAGVAAAVACSPPRRLSLHARSATPIRNSMPCCWSPAASGWRWCRVAAPAVAGISGAGAGGDRPGFCVEQILFRRALCRHEPADEDDLSLPHQRGAAGLRFRGFRAQRIRRRLLLCRFRHRRGIVPAAQSGGDVRHPVCAGRPAGGDLADP